MAIEIKAPLADRLFALGANVGPENPQFKYQGGNRGSYKGRAAPLPTPDQSGDGRSKALGNIAGAAISMFSQQGTPAATDSTGAGFGLGGQLTTGEMGNANYAGTRGMFSFGSEPQNAGTSGLFDGFTYGSN